MAVHRSGYLRRNAIIAVRSLCFVGGLAVWLDCFALIGSWIFSIILLVFVHAEHTNGSTHAWSLVLRVASGAYPY